MPVLHGDLAFLWLKREKDRPPALVLFFLVRKNTLVIMLLSNDL